VKLTKSNLIVVQFGVLALTWGASFLFIKVGLEGLSPAQLVLGRLLSGALALLLLVSVSSVRLPHLGVVWLHLTVVAVLLCVAPFLLFARAEEHVSSGLASIYNATTPLMTMAVALVALPEERPTRSRLVGLLAGFAGVLIVLGPWRGVGAGSAWAQAQCLLATACYGLAFVYLRRFVAPHRLPAIAAATIQVCAGAVIMLVLSPAFGTHPLQLNARVVSSVAALGVVGTGLAYVWNTNVVSAWGATNASTVTYLTPVVGVSLGATLLSEQLQWNQPVGALLVIAGIAITQDRLPRGRPARLNLVPTTPGGDATIAPPTAGRRPVPKAW